MDRAKQEPSIILKIQSKDRLVISSKIPKSLRGAGDLVVCHEFICDISGLFLDFKKSLSTTKPPAPLKGFGNLLDGLMVQALLMTLTSGYHEDPLRILPTQLVFEV